MRRRPVLRRALSLCSCWWRCARLPPGGRRYQGRCLRPRRRGSCTPRRWRKRSFRSAGRLPAAGVELEATRRQGPTHAASGIGGPDRSHPASAHQRPQRVPSLCITARCGTAPHMACPAAARGFLDTCRYWLGLLKLRHFWRETGVGETMAFAWRRLLHALRGYEYAHRIPPQPLTGRWGLCRYGRGVYLATSPR